MPQPVNTQEIGGSIQDFLSSVRAAFEAHFPPKKRADGMTLHTLWVRDIFEDYAVVNDEEAHQLYRVNFRKTDKGLEFDPRTKWEKVKLTYTREMVFDSVITEFKGAPPDVPPRAGVDLAALTQGDSDPFFLTVEISTVGKVSKNGLRHTDALANSLVSQINSRASEGIMGHIREQDRSTAFPVSDIHWLGAVRQGQSAWAKGYIPKTAVAQREHFRILKATSGRAATSITGPAVREFVDKQQGIWEAKDFQLEQLDLAPFTRAALPPQSDFVITKEMGDSPYVLEDNMPTREEILATLTANDVPAAVREQILSQHQQATGQQTRIQELTQQAAEKDDRITVLETAVQEYQRKEFASAIEAKVMELTHWNVTDEKAKEKLASFRRTLKSQMLAELGDNPKTERIAEVAATVWKEMQALAETVRDALAGPSAIVTGRQRGNGRTLEDTPENRQKAHAELGW